MRIIDAVSDLLYPRRCVVCDEVIKFGRKYTCEACASKIVYIKEPFCLKCGKALAKGSTQEYCGDCAKIRHEYICGGAALDYGSVADSMFRFKNKGREEYAEFYAKAIYEVKKEFIESIHPDALVPVPIHRTRLAQRGYNQAYLIARELSKLSEIPVNSKLIERVKKTDPLKNLGHSQRQNNLKKAFKITSDDVKLKTIIIIDDIYTTGSTIDEIARTIHEKVNCKIYFLTVTIGRGI